MNEAAELLNSGKIDQAIPAFQSVVKIDPRNSQAYSSLGYALEAAGRFDEAIVADRRAIELDGTNVWAHWNLGNALYNKGDYEGAETAIGERSRSRLATLTRTSASATRS